ncbi:hypothetical protein [Idiomarina abyssalis]|uniref:hypothetical protein n=1 Tax=Idiomarina abyssalis TaxID=86102 RepID=UPI003A8DC880
MKVLSDVWSSITGNANTRIKDPVIGSFIVAWVICNWDKLAILFLGESITEDRIVALAEKMSIIESPALLYQDKDLLLLPFSLTVIYLFVLPKVSLWVNKKQKGSIISQYSHAVELDIEQAQKQWELNKERLRSDPNREFLGKDVELDIQKDKDRTERRNKIREYISQKQKAANALARKNEAEAELVEQEKSKSKLALEEKKRKNDKEKQRFDLQSQIHKSTLASHRFPASYFFLDRLSKSLRTDEVTMSLEGLSSCIAAIFGYNDFQQLIDDKNFTNEGFEQLEYVLFDDNLVRELDEICQREPDEEHNLDSDLVFDHIQSMFEDLPYEFLSEDGLAEEISYIVHNDSYEIFNSEELSGPMAETNTIFEELYLDVEYYQFNEGFSVNFQGVASGQHRSEPDMKGQDLNVWLKVKCEPVIGKFGLSAPEYDEISGSPEDYGEA